MKKSDSTLKKYLSDRLASAGIELNSRQLDQLWKFHGYLRERNEELNLTRIHNFENIVRKHYVDCLIILKYFAKNKLPFPGVTVDLGSGPGFPGIPLAIALPDKKFILSEGRQQRVRFLEETIELIGLENTTVFGKNMQPSSSLEADAVITRAVERMPETAQRITGTLSEGGQIIFMKGPNCDEEIQEMLEMKNPEVILDFDEQYTLPDSNDERRLVVFTVKRNILAEMNESNSENFKLHTITSEENKIFKILKTLNTGKMIKKHGQTLFCGRKIIQELLFSPYKNQIAGIALTEKSKNEFFQNIKFPENFSCNLYLMGQELFQQIDFYGCRDAVLILNVPELKDWDPSDKKDVTVFLPLSDPENLGAAFRSCAAFDFNHIVLLSEASHPYHGKTIRASAGEQFHLSLSKGPSMNDLNPEFPLYALDMEGENIENVDWPESFGLLIGMEGTGIPKNVNVKKIKIPISDKIDSLNASVALGIALYEINKIIQRRST